MSRNILLLSLAALGFCCNLAFCDKAASSKTLKQPKKKEPIPPLPQPCGRQRPHPPKPPRKKEIISQRSTSARII